MNAQLSVLERFNEKVTRLEATRLAKWLDTTIPNVSAQMERIQSEKTGDLTFDLIGEIHATLDEHDQDDIDAFVLTYRMFVQKNDALSIRALSKIYRAPWMPDEARERC